MTIATMRLIEAVERLSMIGEIGDGMVATLHDLASAARIEQHFPLPPVDEALQRYNRAETRLRRAREAMDASTLGGRSRISEAQDELSAAREAYEDQPGMLRGCRHVFHEGPRIAIWQTCPACGHP